MKKPLQALLVAGEAGRNAVLANEKQISIREGHRDYVKGPILIGCHILNWAVMKYVTSIRQVMLRGVTFDELRDAGFEDHASAIETLKQWYPDINRDSAVTVIRWEEFGA